MDNIGAVLGLIVLGMVLIAAVITVFQVKAGLETFIALAFLAGILSAMLGKR